MFYRILVPLFLCLYATSSFAGDIVATKSNSSFQEVAHIDQLQQISVSEVPVTTYTPKNLKSQQQLRFQGRNTSNGSMTFWSTTITDYDTKIVESKEENGDYYIIDNTGKQIKTGEHTDLTSINTSISNHTTQINNLNNNINTNTSNINHLNTRIANQDQQINNLTQRMNKVEHKIDSGIATATAISAMKSNPRSKANCEMSVGMGVYRDKSAIATGLIYHYNDNVMVTGGVGYSDPDTVGFGSVTFSLF